MTMAKKNKDKSEDKAEMKREVHENSSEKEVQRTDPNKKSEVCKVTLLQNNFVSGVLYKKDDEVVVSPEHKARLVRKSPTVYK